MYMYSWLLVLRSRVIHGFPGYTVYMYPRTHIPRDMSALEHNYIPSDIHVHMCMYMYVPPSVCSHYHHTMYMCTCRCAAGDGQG